LDGEIYTADETADFGATGGSVQNRAPQRSWRSLKPAGLYTIARTNQRIGLQFEGGLSAGGNRIPTIGAALVKGLSAVADERCRTDQLDGVIKHRSSRETTMVGRGASLDGRLFLGGTDGSNPVPSSEESCERWSPLRLGLRVIRRTVDDRRTWWCTHWPISLGHSAARWQSALQTLAIVRRCNRIGCETIARTRSKQKSQAILRLTRAALRSTARPPAPASPPPSGASALRNIADAAAACCPLSR